MGAGAVLLPGEGAAWWRRQGTLQQDWDIAGQTSGSCSVGRPVLAAAAGFSVAGCMQHAAGSRLGSIHPLLRRDSLSSFPPEWDLLLAGALMCQGMSGSALSVQRLGGQGRSVEMWHVIGKSSFLSSCRTNFFGQRSVYFCL